MVVDDSRNEHVHVVPSAFDCFYSCGCPTDGEWFTPGTLLKMTPEPESFERKDKMTHAFIWKISLSARRIKTRQCCQGREDNEPKSRLCFLSSFLDEPSAALLSERREIYTDLGSNQETISTPCIGQNPLLSPSYLLLPLFLSCDVLIYDAQNVCVHVWIHRIIQRVCLFEWTVA